MDVRFVQNVVSCGNGSVSGCGGNKRRGRNDLDILIMKRESYPRECDAVSIGNQTVRVLNKTQLVLFSRVAEFLH